MNSRLLETDVQEFIRTYNGEIPRLVLSGSPFNDIPSADLIQQIESWKKCQKKLPTWFSTQGLYFPPKLHLEQTSSELTAKYKASLVSGKKIADLTGGFGVDSYYFSEVCDTVDHFELNEELSKIAAHNFKVFRKENINCYSEDGLKNLKRADYDTVYVDPSRRNVAKGKVFFLSDCAPNVSKHLETLLSSCEQLIIKTSPMLDIQAGISELRNVNEIHVVGIENEVKELLWILNKKPSEKTLIKTVNLGKEGSDIFHFFLNELDETIYGLPKKFLYEPNSMILKSGGFSLLSKKYNIAKLHKHSHLYTSDQLLEFPGRTFIIERVVPYTKKDMKTALGFSKANITTRNFPENVQTLRKKWKLSDGGHRYLFFTILENDEKIMLICSKPN